MNDSPQRSPDQGDESRRAPPPLPALGRWLDRVDPGTHRRIKGLRLVTAYGVAAGLGALQDIAHHVPGSIPLSYLAGSFALWASVSEGKSTRAESGRRLLPYAHWLNSTRLSHSAGIGTGPLSRR